MAEGGAAEVALTASNAEMLEQRARFGRIRERSVFVGDLADVVDRGCGPGLPGIREWTRENFQFSGYVTGFEQPSVQCGEDLRRELGVGADERLCLVTVGGSCVVQGGLTTCMKLTALRKPFVYVPLRHHFEQNFHVRTASTASRPGGSWTTRTSSIPMRSLRR